MNIQGLLYSIGIHIYTAAIRVSAHFNPKAKLWVDGRKSLFEKMESELPDNEKRIWFHAASMGEMEQAKPLIELFKKENTGRKIVLTFFSPSGYENFMNNGLVDYVFYLPADLPNNCQRFLDLVNPEVAIFIKYEFWFNYIKAINKRNIPMLVVSAVFRSDQYFFGAFGSYYLNKLKSISHIFVQDEESKKLLEAHGINRVTTSGDTRFDRVKSVANAYKRNETLNKDEEIIAAFCESRMVLVAGSTWIEDEELISEISEGDSLNMKILIVPHETHKDHITRLKQLFEIPALVLSSSSIRDARNSRVLIVDKIGLLSRIYRFGQIAYIGGGFGTGIHNILEPTAFGLPVLFGPNHQKSLEAAALINQGCAFVISNEAELKEQIFKISGDETLRNEISVKTLKYIDTNSGASVKIVSAMLELIGWNND